MPIRAQCDNCGKTYNVPDTSAGKRLRCKQCAAVFTVPAAAAPAEALTVARQPQKICVVCRQDVAGKPRTKDQSGNYYCRACYEEKASAREQLTASRVGAAVPAGVGGGDGGGDGGEMIDLAALEPTEQFDESTQPPPPPIPDLDFVAPPIPDMEPVMAEPVVIEAPKPRKKKKKKKVAAAKSVSADNILAKIVGLPFEIWVIGVGVMIVVAALVNHKMAGPAVGGLIMLGLGCLLWGHICCAIVAFAEDTATGVRYVVFPFYQLFFILTNWSLVQRYVLRMGLGAVFMVCAVGVSVKLVKDAIDEVSSRHPNKTALKNLSSDQAFKITVDLEEPPDEDEAALDKREKEIADTILASLKQRGVKPPPGETYHVEATVEMSASDTEKISIPIKGRTIQMPAPMLICQLVIKNSAEGTVFDQSKNIVVPKDALTKASDKEKEDGLMEKELWKKVPGEFQALAAQVPLNGAGGNAAPSNGSDASKTATPDATAAPK